MSRATKWILALNLVALALLAFVYPHLMISPGALIPGHARIETDCFACHAPLAGAESTRCVVCHKPADIGKLTTNGKPVLKPLTKTPFHQKLASDDCVACHSDHAGVKRYRQQGRFDHALLKAALVKDCHTCHQAPADDLHRQITGNCSACHSQQRWTPASFDHDKYFVLDRDHNASCATCHVRNNYAEYTCYGCHEHTQANVRSEHIEEGIRDFSNCVECHRSADEDDIREPGGSGKRKRGDHDD